MKKQLTILGTLLAATAAQAQLVPGGDFEYDPASWPTYFTTGYTPGYIPTVLPNNGLNNFNALDGAGRLTINTTPQDMAPAWPNFGAAPAIPGTQFLIVNGSLDANQVVWNLAAPQHIPVVAGQTYFFEAYFANINQTANNLGTLTFQLQFSPDNVSFGPNQVLGTPNVQATGVGEWNILTNPSWEAPGNGWVDLQIVNANSEFNGNDFAIDNINFGRTLVPEASSFLPALAALGLGGLYVARRKR